MGNSNFDGGKLSEDRKDFKMADFQNGRSHRGGISLKHSRNAIKMAMVGVFEYADFNIGHFKSVT